MGGSVGQLLVLWVLVYLKHGLPVARLVGWCVGESVGWLVGF